MGLEILSVADNWVPEELTLMLRPVAPQPAVASREPSGAAMDWRDCVGQRIGWLVQISSLAREGSRAEIGLFGTSIAATWLFSELQGGVGFFVDEDPNRIGKRWQGRPVYHPRQIPSGSCLMIPLPFTLAESIARRIARPGFELCLPSATTW